MHTHVCVHTYTYIFILILLHALEHHTIIKVAPGPLHSCRHTITIIIIITTLATSTALLSPHGERSR